MNIAIVRLSALGDIVHSMIVLQFIKKHLPDAKITWITQKNFEDILKNNPDVDKIVSVDLKQIKKNFSIKEVKKLINKLQNLGDFDYVLDIQGLIKSAIISKFLGKNRYGLEVGCAKESLATIFYKKKIIIPCEKNVIYRNLDFVSKVFNFTYNDEEILNKKSYLFYDKNREYSKIDNLLKEKNILIVPGSSKTNKNYPAQNFIDLINNLKENVLLLWGNEEEKDKAIYISKYTKATVLPRLTLNDLKYLISKMDLVIGGDTGPVHMAWAMNKPSIVLFGYTPVSLMYQTKINKAIKSPSIANLCRFDKSDDSIKDIKIEKILKIKKELIG
ncbi:lipopolysaccharide heptosyltransferase I [Nitrosophilus kaiyonis]|uniref:lipopolysaccharide heptosyltransferase I n=1 Tax=Nitrosophilus kaiyonis TaxID=2930200 RepID=UPI0024909A86|nr:lipopolysaccharide heptosyltransferase I [Nitrosophilus kaiyonis]